MAEIRFDIIDKNTIDRLTTKDVDLLPKAIDIPKAEQWNKKQIQRQMAEGINKGEAIPKIAKRFENVIGMTTSQSVRNARTAITNAENAGRLDRMNEAKAMGIKVQKEWIATNDSRTRDSHASINGEIVDIDKKFSNDCDAPGDYSADPAEVYNCRCTLGYALPNLEDDVQEIEKNETLIEDNYNVNTTQSLKKAYDERIEHFNLNLVKSNDIKGEIIKADLKGIEKNNAKKISEQIDALTQKYHSTITKITVGNKNDFIFSKEFASTMHYGTVSSSEIILNPIKINKIDRIKELSKKGWAVKIKDGKEAEYVVTHEFAHTLINTKMPLKNYVNYDIKPIKKAQNEINEIYEKYKLEVTELQKMQKEYEFKYIMGDVEAGNKAKETIKKLSEIKISDYSLVDADEFMAEAFTQRELGQEISPYAEKVLKIIDKNFKK